MYDQAQVEACPSKILQKSETSLEVLAEWEKEGIKTSGIRISMKVGSDKLPTVMVFWFSLSALI